MKTQTTPTKPSPIYLKAQRGEWLTGADLAKLIRQALKSAYPGAKFSVQTRSAGGAIDVSWIDGPTHGEVYDLTRVYQTVGFDGSIDMAYSKDLWLYPDGRATLAHRKGTEGSAGSVSEIIRSADNHQAVLLSNVVDCYVFVSREYSIRALAHGLDLMKAYQYAELEGFDFSTITLHSFTTSAGAYIKNEPTVQLQGRWFCAQLRQTLSTLSL